MSSVGFTARKVDPVEELRVAYQNLTETEENELIEIRNYKVAGSTPAAGSRNLISYNN